MLTKDMVYSSLEEMPDEFELDDFIERLIFLQKIRTGLEQLGEGKKEPHQEVRQMVETWRKQHGQSKQMPIT